MNRISRKFEELKARDGKGFIPFVTAGDPDLETSREIVLTLARSGADIIELGVPFSDPMADGPSIQASSQRALAKDVSLGKILQMVRELRSHIETPIVIFSYYNPLFRYGIERLAADASAAGIDGVLITDVVDDEASQIATIFNRYEMDLISLIAPTTSDERLKKISGMASGFLYAVSRAGVTGAQSETSQSAKTLVKKARQFSTLPIAVGFGISTAEQIAEVWDYANAAVVGSAIVRVVENSIEAGTTVERVKEFVDALLPQVANQVAEI